MQLAGWDGGRNNLFDVRHLAEEELLRDKRSRPVVTEARGRFKLFGILEMNYREWTDYHRALLTPGSRKGDNLLVLDRLMFNFLASAYGLMEHFEVSYRRRHKRNQAKLKEYETFLDRMCDASWAVAFFMDFRNYAQHFALPIGTLSRNETSHAVTISITQDADLLTREYSGWRRSRLSKDRGQLDLIGLAAEYYQRLRHDYGGFMAQCFYPELKEIDAFYWGLTQEVRQRSPTARMVFVAEKEETKTSIRCAYEQPPNAVFEEMGIAVDR